MSGADIAFDTLPHRRRYAPRMTHRIEMADCHRKMNRELALLDSPVETTCTAAASTSTVDITSAASGKTLNISMIGAAPFNTLIQQYQTGKVKDMQIFSASMRDIEIALAPKTTTDPATKLPAEYHDFLDVFSKKDSV